MRSLEAFLAHNGQWEAAAAAVDVHRHTMRNRMGKVRELLGKDVDAAHVRAELWLAVKARELLRISRAHDVPPGALARARYDSPADDPGSAGVRAVATSGGGER